MVINRETLNAWPMVISQKARVLTAWRAVENAKFPRLHIFIATSPIHMVHKLKMTPEEVLEEIRFGVRVCKSLCPNVEFSAEDATRSDLVFLREALACAAENARSQRRCSRSGGERTP